MNFSIIKGASAAFVMAAMFGSTALAAPATYNIDSAHTLITFKLNHLGFSTHNGWIGSTKGSFIFDQENPEASSVSVVLDAGSLATNLGARDDRLHGDEFLDVAKFPQMTFKSTKVEATGKNTGKITGDFTLHGITLPVVLDVVFNKAGTDPISKKEVAGFTATGSFVRSEYGVAKFAGPIGDAVSFTIDIEGRKAE